MRECYLDNSATTRVSTKSAEAVLRVLRDCYGNPSSLHGKGVEAQKELDLARKILADSLSADPSELYFTGGGTEANNLAVLGGVAALRRRGNRIVSTQLEHPSVYDPLSQLEREGFEVIRLKPDRWGQISLEDLEIAVSPQTILVSMMLVNNEMGSILPVSQIAKVVKRKGAPALIHCDAVQAYGKMPVKVNELKVDLLTLSSHKIHGPKGAGALYVRKGKRVLPRQFGGLQEQPYRPGTEPLPAIAGFGAAAAEITFSSQAAQLNGYLRKSLSALPYVTVNSAPDASPHLVNLSLPPIKSETLLHFLSSQGIYVSSGSACSKGKKSRVLTACGLPDPLIDSALRISFSRYNTREDIDRLVEQLVRAHQTLAGSNIER